MVVVVYGGEEQLVGSVGVVRIHMGVLRVRLAVGAQEIGLSRVAPVGV